jgi:hypothetical protein
MITTCDENSLPAKVLFQDTNGHSLREVTFVRDAAGRLVKEEMRVEPTGLLSLADNVPEESRAEFAAMLAKTFGETFSRTTYEYDPRGRRLQRNIEFGSLSESRTTYQYDDHDDPISETTEDRNRELSTDDEGKEHYSSDRESVQQHRFEYIYDGHGNWTERIVQHSNVERRSITYY